MNRDRYSPLSDAARETYEFLSSGPKGTIKKVVQYLDIGDGVFNIGFGDWDEVTQTISDDVRTNNSDRDKVLATVAFTVFDFMKYHPEAVIYAQGSTAGRTRLYQTGIADNLAEINQLFDVEGYYNGGWEPFKKGKNYQAFILKAK